MPHTHMNHMQKHVHMPYLEILGCNYVHELVLKLNRHSLGINRDIKGFVS